jgi:hypothetical protein
MKNLRIYIKKHASFLVIILGAVAVFLVNIILKMVLSQEQYGEYSLFISYLQLMVTFGLLGFEQVFLRISEAIDNRTIQTSKKLIIIILFVWAIFGLLSSIGFMSFFSSLDVNSIYLIICTLSVTASIFLYNIFRLNSSFLISQFMLNNWRFVLILLTIVGVYIYKIDLESFIKLFSYFLLLLLVLQSYFTFKRIHFEYSIVEVPKRIYSFAINFFIALFTISIISFGDRFFIKVNFGAIELGEYFFLATIFIFPFSLLQGYIGFKELVFYKNLSSEIKIGRKIVMLNFLGVLFGGFLVVCSIISNQLEIIPNINIKNNIVIVIIFIFTGVLKLNYSLFSAILGARGEVITIRKANVQSIVSIFAILFLFYRKLDKLEYIAFIVLLFWLSRIFIWNYNIMKQLKKS